MQPLQHESLPVRPHVLQWYISCSFGVFPAQAPDPQTLIRDGRRGRIRYPPIGLRWITCLEKALTNTLCRTSCQGDVPQFVRCEIWQGPRKRQSETTLRFLSCCNQREKAGHGKCGRAWRGDELESSHPNPLSKKDWNCTFRRHSHFQSCCKCWVIQSVLEQHFVWIAGGGSVRVQPAEGSV